MRRNVFRHDGSCRDHRIGTQRDAGDDRRVSADRTSSLDNSALKPAIRGVISVVDVRHSRRPRKHIIGKHGVRSDKHVVFDRNSCPQADMVFHRDVVTHNGAALDEPMITDVAITSDLGTWQHVSECPNVRAGADLISFDERLGMNKRGRHFQRSMITIS